jgi:hypothetical protein
LGAALVALLLLSADLGDQAGTITKSRAGETPIMVEGVGVQLSLTEETRAGESPIVPGTDPQGFVAEVVTPLVGLELRRPTFTAQAFYDVRLYWQDPTPVVATSTRALTPDLVSRIQGRAISETTRSGALVLHSLGFTLHARPARPLFFELAGTGSVGSPDYTALPQVLGTNQSALPPVVRLASGMVHGSAILQVAPRWELTLAAELFAWTWLDVPDDLGANAQIAGQTLVTSQTQVTVVPGVDYILTPRDSLGLGAALGEVWFSDGLAIATVTPEVNWKRRLTQRNNLKLILGLTFAHTEAVGVDVKDPLAPSGSAVSPIGSFQLSSRLLGSRGITLQSDVTGGVDYYVDPVLGTALPRAEGAIGATLIAVPTWMVILQGSFATALKTPPPLLVVGQTLSILPDETVFSISLSGRRRISENFFAELGGMYADRGPVLSTPDFRFHQRQLWVNFALTGTTRPISRQTLQIEQQ